MFSFYFILMMKITYVERRQDFDGLNNRLDYKLEVNTPNGNNTRVCG